MIKKGTINTLYGEYCYPSLKLVYDIAWLFGMTIEEVFVFSNN